MHILHVITRSSVGGAQSVVVNLANVQVADGHRVSVISSDEGGAWDALAPEVEVIGLSQLRREISLRDAAVAVQLYRHYRRLNPDVVHLHSSKTGALGRMLFPSRKTVYTVHGFDSIRLGNPKFLPLERLLQYKSGAIVGVSRYDQRHLLEEGIRRRVHFVYNGIQDIADQVGQVSPEALEHLEEIRRHHGKVVMCIGRDNTPQKKIDLFFEVASLLPQYAFVWVGNGKTYENLPSNVYTLGLLPMAVQLLGKADLFYLPTNYEGMPISIIESLSYSLPVVATNVGGIGELLDGENGLAMDNTADGMAAAIARILEDGDTYRRMSENARRSYEARFSVRQMVDGYYAIYRSLQA